MKASNKIKNYRCAIYTRKPHEEGLEQEFNSLDAQRESGKVYIKSQQHEQWKLLSQHYNDGGFSGGNLERPTLKRLLFDIEQGKIDIIVVYKVGRLSRSLGGSAKLMDLFDSRYYSYSIRIAGLCFGVSKKVYALKVRLLCGSSDSI